MTTTPSSGDALTRAMQMRRRAMSTGKALGVRSGQAGGYVGIKVRPPPPVEQFPVGKAWLDLFAADRRDAGAMAREACAIAGRHFAHQGKFDNEVKKQLRALGKERLWETAKVKSGRPSRAPG